MLVSSEKQVQPDGPSLVATQQPDWGSMDARPRFQNKRRSRCDHTSRQIRLNRRSVYSG
jgi:hypothetical protein